MAIQSTKQFTQTAGNASVTTKQTVVDNSCASIPINGPFGNKTIGPRTVIVPADPIIWNEETSYEYLTLVASEDFGNSYISKKDVPAGTELTNQDYWIPAATFNAQLADIQNTITILDYINGLSPEYYGVVEGSGIDNSAALKTAFEHGAVFSPDKTYEFSSTIVIDKRMDYNLHNCNLIYTGNEIAISIQVPYAKTPEFSIMGLNLTCQNNINYGITVGTSGTQISNKCTLENISINMNGGTGIILNSVYQFRIINSDLNGESGINTGVINNIADIVLDNVYGRRMNVFMEVHGNAHATNCHSWMAPTDDLSGSVMFDIVSGKLTLSQCVIDTYETGIKLETNTAYVFGNLQLIIPSNATYTNTMRLYSVPSDYTSYSNIEVQNLMQNIPNNFTMCDNQLIDAHFIRTYFDVSNQYRDWEGKIYDTSNIKLSSGTFSRGSKFRCVNGILYAYASISDGSQGNITFKLPVAPITRKYDHWYDNSNEEHRLIINENGEVTIASYETGDTINFAFDIKCVSA